MAVQSDVLTRQSAELESSRAHLTRVRRQGRLLVVSEAPLNAEAPRSALRSYLTPAAVRFLRTNFGIPSLDTVSHQVQVGGAVERPFTLRLAELHGMPRRALTITTECAGNHRTSMAPLPAGEPWQGGAVSTASWSGVPLSAVLERAGLRPGCVEVLVSGADAGTTTVGETRYQRSLPAAKAMDPDVLLALEMNGKPIAAAHGGPLRLLVPGWYGMASVKWVSSIEALEANFEGYFQTQRYVYREPGAPPQPVAEMRVKSVFVSPAPSARVRMGAVRVRGLAWSGSAPIAKVKISIGGGGEFAEARLLGRAEPFAWRRWELIWRPPHCGRHVLRCCATDQAGNVQPDAPAWNELGYGANGVQSLAVDVR